MANADQIQNLTQPAHSAKFLSIRSALITHNRGCHPLVRKNRSDAARAHRTDPL